MDKKRLIVVVLLIVVAIAAYYLGYMLANKNAQAKITILENALMPFYPTQMSGQVLSVGGTIKAVSGSKITLETRKVFTDLYDRITRANETELKTVDVASDTVISEISFLPPANVKPGQVPPPPAEKKLKLSDLHVGDQITAVSKNDLSGVTEFNANRIVLNFRAPQAPTPSK